MSASAGPTWTEERVERLKTLWIEGLSASQIASDLGGVTRNAVIGKVHRLGLSGRQRPGVTSVQKLKPEAKQVFVQARKPRAVRSQAGSATAPVPSPSPVCEQRTQPLAEKSNVIPMSRHLTIQELDTHTCRWPIGDPQSPQFRYCGAPTEPGQVYCGPCCQKAYLPKENKRKPAAAIPQTQMWRQVR